MLQYLTTRTLLEAAYHQIAALLGAHCEWLFVSAENVQSLRSHEIEIEVKHERLLLSCWTERGTKWWRICGWNWNGQSLALEASNGKRARNELLELVPRTQAKAISAAIRAARQARAERLAYLAAALTPETTVERLSLSRGTRSGQPGRYAHFLLSRRQQRIAVMGLVVAANAAAVDSFLSAALLWFIRVNERVNRPAAKQLWLLVSRELVKPLVYRIALIREGLRDVVRVFGVDNDLTSLAEVNCPHKSELWKKKVARFPPVAAAVPGNLSETIVAAAPAAIDVVQARHGETLRYFGLPFARVRSVLRHEKIWFGVDRAHRCLLDQSTAADWRHLLNELRKHRSSEATDHRHALYRAAPEAWLESLLRRDVTKLDPGLIIAPLHAQFRTARGAKLGIRPIDLLALRQDGRLVVIELKVSEDREHVLQGADYWRRVEAHRRRGHISRAKLFGERVIKDEPPLVYLVAPTLRVHPAFEALARCISSDIEIYRFDINEDWRAGVRVMRRRRVN